MEPDHHPLPELRPEDKISADDFAKVAHDLLSEVAKTDETLAAKLRELGMPPDWDDS